MSPEVIGIIGLVILFLLIAIRMPIGVAMALVGYVGASSIIGLKAGTAILGISPFDTAKSYTLSVVPLFVLMGLFAAYSGITKETFRAVHRWVGHLPGGLAMATIGACAGFAAVCGSSFATAATIGKVALPEMRAYRYDDKLATGSVAAGGTLGILIPPSMSFIIYAVITEQSVGKLFIAGIFPGLLLAGLMMLTIYILTKRNPQLGPAGPKSGWAGRLKAMGSSWGILTLFFVVMGGIWFGIFTPTEAAGIGTAIAFILVIINRQLSKETMIASLKDTAKTTGMVFALVIGALIFNYFMAVSKLPMAMSNLVSGLEIHRYGVLVVIIFIYLLLGCLMDTLSMLLLTLPIIFPTVFALGFDPIWFGVVVTLLTEIALITPPIGLNVFVIAGIASGVTLQDVFRGVLPFLLALGVCMVILILFPEIALFLPSFMG